jgi:hypothetical protein
MRTLTLTLLAILITASFAWGQSDKETDLYLGGGIAFPAGPQNVKDCLNMGFNAGAGVGFSLTPAVSLIVSVGYGFFPANESGYLKRTGTPSSVTASTDGGSASALDIAGNIKLSLDPVPNRASFYVVAGVGYSTLSFSEFRATYAYYGTTTTWYQFKDRSAISTSLGTGIDIPAGETISIFVEGRYLIAFTEHDNTSSIPIRAGAKIAF